MSVALAEHDEDIRLVDLLLEEQQSLTAVERFAGRHAADSEHLQERYYRDLIPSALPDIGEQYAFRVDLDKCTGCKACVTACHSLNGLDADEAWRDIGLIVGNIDNTADVPVQQTVTTTCHHCEEPACLAGCPVQAYEKDPATGIVRHLDDQCIGCQYCVLKCPYDVPKYDSTRGIVRKCDMCTGRLSAGEAPACVQGCPTDAISITVVPQGRDSQTAWLPVVSGATPDTSITRPTTQYVTQRLSSLSLAPANQSVPEPSAAHTPLAFMMLAVQLSVGLLIVDGLAGLVMGAEAAALRTIWTSAAATIAAIGLAGAFVHLGRPLYAYRAFLGWRTSWMSREILVLGPFVGLTAVCAAAWLGEGLLNANLASNFLARWLPMIRACLGPSAIAVGLVGTYCSAMIYVDTKRPFWSLESTLLRFFGSVFVLGPAAGLALGVTIHKLPLSDFALFLSLASVAAVTIKIAAEASIFRHRGSAEHEALARSVEVIAGPLRTAFVLRVGSAAAGVAALGSLLWVAQNSSALLASIVSVAAFVLLLTGEALERHLFFRAEAARAMPRL